MFDISIVATPLLHSKARKSFRADEMTAKELPELLLQCDGAGV